MLSIDLYECACNCETNGTSLAIEATTLEVHLDIVLLGNTYFVERLLNDELKDRRGEIRLEFLTVDCDVTSTSLNINAGYGGLAAANCINYFCHSSIVVLVLITSVC